MLSLILHQVVDEGRDLSDDHDEIREHLASAGFESEEIDTALSWLESYFRASPDEEGVIRAPDCERESTSQRILCSSERLMIPPEALGFLHGLEYRGIISADTKEEILSRAMNMFEEPISLDEMKIVTLITLYERGGGNMDEMLRLINAEPRKSYH
jgi:uncharacterized protein Smg (DUF494 family)